MPKVFNPMAINVTTISLIREKLYFPGCSLRGLSLRLLVKFSEGAGIDEVAYFNAKRWDRRSS